MHLLWETSVGKSDLCQIVLIESMPAIAPARLKIQSAELASLYRQPSRFRIYLIDLLEQYADYSYRVGDAAVARSLLPTYHAPVQVIKQIAHAILEAGREDQWALFELSKVLWQESNFECCLLAGRILGQLSNIPDDLILDTLRQWQPFQYDETLQELLFENGFGHIIQRNLTAMLKLADEWLDARDSSKNASGLLLLKRIASQPRFENSPVIFQRISPYLRQVPIEVRLSLIRLLERLARVFPQELTYNFLESLKISNSPDTVPLIRQILPLLPPDLQSKLRNALLPNKKKA